MAALKQFEAGVPVNDLCRQVGVSPATFYKWKAKYGGLDASEQSRLRGLEEENLQLMQMYADLSLRAHAMEIVLSKKVLSLDQRRDVVARLVETESAPAQVACRVMGLPRSSWYYVKRGRPAADDPVIEAFLRDCVARRPRRGFHKCFMRARRVGHPLNHKRVYRVYKQLGLNLRRRIKHRLPARVQQPLVAPLAPDQGWSMDFTSDRLTNGRTFRTLNLIDEFNREALAIEVDTSLPSSRVIRVLEQLKTWRPLPKSIRVDNRPEFIAEVLGEWCQKHDIHLNFISPGKPQKNGYVERFNHGFREDIPDCYLFDSLDEVRDMVWDWQIEYNEQRFHDSLNNLTPVEYWQRYETQLAEVSRY